MENVILAIAIFCGIAGVYFLKKTQKHQLGIVLVVLMCGGLVYYAVMHYTVSSRLSDRTAGILFDGQAYVIARVMKDHFPNAKQAVVLGWGDAERVGKMNEAIKNFGCSNTEYIALFEKEPLSPEERMFSAVGKAYKDSPAVESADLLFSVFGFDTKTAKHLKKGQQIVMIDSLPDKELWEKGVVKVAVRRKGNLSQESLSEDPEKYYQEACGVYVNDGKLTFDAHGNFK